MKKPSLKFQVDQVPFSRAGAYQSFSRLTEPRWWFHRGPSQLVWRNLHGDAVGTLAELSVLRNSKEIAFREEGTPECLTLTPVKGKGWIKIAFHDSTNVVFTGHKIGLRLKTPNPGDYDQIQPDGPVAWKLNFCTRKSEFRFVPLEGKLEIDAPWDGVKCRSIMLNFLPDLKSDDWKITAREIRWARKELPPVKIPWENWLRLAPRVPKPFSAARELAAYVTWSALVDPYGHFERPAMYMSKNWMQNLWSWDHCFNAIALVRTQPRLAWDQLMIPFDFQVTSGQLPDGSNDSGMLFNFVKPPIHGWALDQLMKRTSWIGPAQLKEFYPKLAAWTEWWFAERDSDRDGLPQYNHGNDSGWDNATCYKVGMPVEGPELAAFLILQMDTLAKVARRIGKPSHAKRWTSRADKLLRDLLAHHWKNGRFVAPRSGDHATHESDSLIPFVPLVLGPRLPGEITRQLLAGLKKSGRFLTAHGLATESPSSDQYEADGYWRGPIWAPPVFLLVTGLEKLGEKTLARTIAQRFCRTCAKSGMAENFDALTGRGLRDPAYTWTASVFLTLASEWL